MIVAIHQPHYLPWLRYFEKIARADVFVVLDTVQYTKNGWQNRNRIKGPRGPLRLTVPVHAALGETIGGIGIDNAAPWARKHWRTLVQHYAPTPYFAGHAPFFEAVYAERWEHLSDLNCRLIEYLAAALGIHTPMVRASECPVPGDGAERLINLVRAVGGDTYYSGAYALDAYLDARALEAAGIRLLLQEWSAPVYPQRYGPFAADLSIVDLLFNCGPASRETLLGAPP